jgi:outer membrane protein OmpA-like peptidoglycan-associated protein
MPGKWKPALVLLTLAVIPGLTGCASKGYVNKRIDEMTGETRSDVAALKTETSQLRNSTEEALARAATAVDSASEARQLALGRAGLEEIRNDTVRFKFDSDMLGDDAKSQLEQTAAVIEQHPEAIVDVYGFADQTGPDRYTLDLGQRRAMEVVRYLIDHASNNLSRFAAVSYGERPIRGTTFTGERQDARRVVVSVLRRVPLDASGRPRETAEARP